MTSSEGNTGPLSTGTGSGVAQQGVEVQSREERFYRASQWQLVWWKFRRHRLARLASVVLAGMYLAAIVAEFVSPHDPHQRFMTHLACPPMAIRIYDPQDGVRLPFVYGKVAARDPVSARLVYQDDRTTKHPVRLFVRGDAYEMWGFLPMDVHLLGADGTPLFLLGSDLVGRDVFSRAVHGARISLTVGLVGVAFSFTIGLLLGAVSGYFGGGVDEVIQRVIDVLISLPTIPLWMSLAAALPQDWPQLRVYFGITIILSVLGWTVLGRVVRGKLLSLRDEDFVLAARLDGESNWTIITRYLIPTFMSYLIVSLTLAVPNMILGETSLSFLGIGLRTPTISWGVMLQDAQNIMTIAQLPWLLWPVLFVVVSVLMFNFLGDGLRDAADPYVT